ncbi:MAG: putative lipoate-protein ligase [Fibrobacteres bacterium]|nr:putative lipoate-protein ligase [Fibrobacterota bacterium]
MPDGLPMSDAIQPLRHNDILPEENPTGEQLLDRVQRPYRIWVPRSKAIVLGNSQDAEKELKVDAVKRDGIPVHKRMSGGGAVLLSPGCLCLGLRFAKRKEITIQDYFAKASALISGIVSRELGLDLRLRGTSDLACTMPSNGASVLGTRILEGEDGVDGIRERKVAGCALYMPRDYVLYLASILVDPDFKDIDAYLAHPSKEPEYRSGRTHREFLAGLAELSGKPVRPAEMVPWFEKKIPEEPGLDLDWEIASEKPDPVKP